MASTKRIVITDEKAVKALCLISAMTGEDPSEIATRAALDLWDQEAENIEKQVKELSPLKAHMEQSDDGENIT
jgi:hypothetical protein